MKTRNISLENTPLLTNHICKHVVLEAPTELELDKKVKQYESILIRAITNAYRLSNLTLDNKGTCHVSPTDSYKTSIFMNFEGKKLETIINPEKTLHYVKQLTGLESKKQHESNILTGTTNFKNETSHTNELIIEADNESEIDKKIAAKQRELLENLVERVNISQISFLTTSKHIDSKTGKIIIKITAHYKCREIKLKKEEHTGIDEGNR